MMVIPNLPLKTADVVLRLTNIEIVGRMAGDN
jgi:hypothetical protein